MCGAGGQTGVNSFITIRNNTVHDVYGRDREAITSDGGFTSYLGTVAAVGEGGLALELSSDPVFVLDPTHGMEMVHEDCVGIAVYSAPPAVVCCRQQHQRQPLGVCIDVLHLTTIRSSAQSCTGQARASGVVSPPTLGGAGRSRRRSMCRPSQGSLC